MSLIHILLTPSFENESVRSLHELCSSLAVDARRAPQRVRDAHLANELTNICRHSWSTAAKS